MTRLGDPPFFFGWGSEKWFACPYVHFRKDPTVLGSIPKYNVCECSHGVIEWFWENPFQCKHTFVRATVTTVIECPGFDAHGSSVLPSSSHWQPSRQLENRILLQKMLNIDTKPSQVHGFLRGIWCVGVSWRTGELTGDVGSEWKVSPLLRAASTV